MLELIDTDQVARIENNKSIINLTSSQSSSPLSLENKTKILKKEHTSSILKQCNYLNYFKFAFLFIFKTFIAFLLFC